MKNVIQKFSKLNQIDEWYQKQHYIIVELLNSLNNMYFNNLNTSKMDLINRITIKYYYLALLDTRTKVIKNLRRIRNT